MNNFNYQNAKKYLATGKNISKVKDLLDKASEAYYNSDEVILTDLEYDELYNLYKKVTGETIIGAKPPEGSKTVSVQHDYDNLVGTLEKAKDLNELKSFITRISKVKMATKYKIRLSLKFDGNSVTIEYDKNGKPKKALTRGQDGLGKDIIKVFKNDCIDNSYVLKSLNSEFAIKYEVIFPYKNYEKLCEDTGKSYANPRSSISGFLNKNDAYKYRKYMVTVPLEMRVKNDGFSFNGSYKNLYTDELNAIFGDDNYYNKYAKTYSCETLKDVMDKVREYYNEVNNIRTSLPFMIDGIVLEFLNKRIINEYFYDNKGFIPQYAIAIKLPYLEKMTEVTNIDYCIGNTGRITPRIWFKPVEFNGTKHLKQQISNYKRFNELKLGIGSNIMVSYHNDCLSYITKVKNQPNGIIPFKFPTKCPVCKSKITIRKNDDGELTLAACLNENCPSRLKGKIENYFIKMNIKGIKMNTIETLYDAKLITDIPSIYKLNYNKVSALVGPKNSENIKNAIESKKYFDYEILGSLSINNFSIESAKALCKVYNLDEIIDLYNNNKLYNSMLKIEGFNDITIKSFIKGFEDNSEMIEFLYSRGFDNYKDTVGTNSLNIVATGWRPDPGMNIKLDKLGITVKSSVSKKTDLLVVNGNGGATKVNKAKELNIPVMKLEDFKEKYNL